MAINLGSWEKQNFSVPQDYWTKANKAFAGGGKDALGQTPIPGRWVTINGVKEDPTQGEGAERFFMASDGKLYAAKQVVQHDANGNITTRQIVPDLGNEVNPYEDPRFQRAGYDPGDPSSRTTDASSVVSGAYGQGPEWWQALNGGGGAKNFQANAPYDLYWNQNDPTLEADLGSNAEKQVASEGGIGGFADMMAFGKDLASFFGPTIGLGFAMGGGFGNLSDAFSQWMSGGQGAGAAAGWTSGYDIPGAMSNFWGGGTSLADIGQQFAQNLGDTASDASFDFGDYIPGTGEQLIDAPSGGGNLFDNSGNLLFGGGGPDPLQVASSINGGNTPLLGMANQLYNPATGALAGAGASGALPGGVSLKEIVNYGGNLVSSLFGANAAGTAANQQADAARAASATVRGMYDQTRSDLLPWQAQGRIALSQLGDMTSGPSAALLKPFGMEDFKASPAYQFNLEEGLKAINKGAAARGKYYAPSTLQDVGKYAQGVASNEWNNAYGQYNQNMQNIWNRLYSLSGSGQNAAAQIGGFGTNAANQVAQNQIGAGNAQAAGTVGQANAINNGVGNAYNQYLLDQILARNQQPSYTGS